jgi:hypothetical protein
LHPARVGVLPGLSQLARLVEVVEIRAAVDRSDHYSRVGGSFCRRHNRKVRRCDVVNECPEFSV